MFNFCPRSCSTLQKVARFWAFSATSKRLHWRSQKSGSSPCQVSQSTMKIALCRPARKSSPRVRVQPHSLRTSLPDLAGVKPHLGLDASWDKWGLVCTSCCVHKWSVQRKPTLQKCCWVSRGGWPEWQIELSELLLHCMPHHTWAIQQGLAVSSPVLSQHYWWLRACSFSPGYQCCIQEIHI